ncbi:hypothetical protein QFZ55_003481 [Streptomyces luteogriseus]|uniref:hypothetical protein n=1 Tax=Streptomyces luteogriseus TaxID=68233 RepID=UPI0027864B45|nr:hypothetical protein [Streptomyces luteogriseus]MDQ0714029.1 hypothetical protein [Streptomyces luteogriseus]
MRARVLATSAALLFSLAAALLVGGGSGIDWPAGGGITVVQAQAQVQAEVQAQVQAEAGDIDWP